MLPTQSRVPLHWQILIAIGAGALAGYLVGPDAQLLGVKVVAVFDFIGTLFINAVDQVDYPILMGILTLSAIVIIVANLMADVVYAYLDPRIKYS